MHGVKQVIPTNPRIGTPGYVALCYCGRWSKKFDEAWQAERSILDHVRDKEAEANR